MRNPLACASGRWVLGTRFSVELVRDHLGHHRDVAGLVESVARVVKVRLAAHHHDDCVVAGSDLLGEFLERLPDHERRQPSIVRQVNSFTKDDAVTQHGNLQSLHDVLFPLENVRQRANATAGRFHYYITQSSILSIVY